MGVDLWKDADLEWWDEFGTRIFKKEQWLCYCPIGLNPGDSGTRVRLNHLEVWEQFMELAQATAAAREVGILYEDRGMPLSGKETAVRVLKKYSFVPLAEDGVCVMGEPESDLESHNMRKEQ